MNQDEVFTLLRDIRETQLMQASVNGKNQALLEALAGPDGRVKKLESANNRQWWYTIAVTPLLVLLHATARKFGVEV